jgi:UDP-N-acetylmuramoylalanine--D-glutamate ligase
MVELKGRRVLVLGLGDTGLSMARWLARHGADVRVADTREAPPHAATLANELPQVALAAGPFGEHDFAQADTIAISPGLDRRQPLVTEAIRRGVPVVGDIEIFAQALAALVSRQSSAVTPQVLAITGSNGKSTVTAMAGEMCRAAGKQTVVAGNIGLPVLDALAGVEREWSWPDVFVLELSSFQLESTGSLRPDAAAMLNLTEDHLDRYHDMADYAAAKARIFRGAGAQVLNRGDARSMAMARPDHAVWTFGLDAPRDRRQWGVRSGAAGEVLARGDQALMPLSELPVAGKHNAANALAALALAHAIGLPDAPPLDALRRFRGLPHRLQRIAEIGGVVFYDDSKGTNVGASVAALSGMNRPVVLIAGGDGKGQDFSPLGRAVANHARAVVLIGRDAPLIDKVIVHSGVARLRADSMEEAVRVAHAASRAGDAVLLSPACASYDMFASYVQRGEAFAAAVRRLEGDEAR